ncbi:SURF1 family protein [Phaeacidiphilus oryzae]|uniref:SURF1 family protein n=1 Tax=Phaeacidiphilus oryzae TaxID=348818 RepID=UPI0005684F0F|nr:SURF1 family protein [Phaeacidiphilus oryzae]
MYRFLLTPRWLGLTLFAMVAVPTCVWLGLWQLSRFDGQVQHSEEQKAHPPSVSSAQPLDVLITGADQAGTTADDVGKEVSFAGVYDTAHQLLVPERQVDQRTGFYLLTPLRLANGQYVPVVRGWMPGRASAAAAAKAPAPGGLVDVVGRMQAPESSSTPGVIGSGALPSGQTGMISAANLLNQLPYQVWNGWIALDRVGRGLTAVPTYQPNGGGGVSMRAVQNLGYTCQWFVFAGFAVFMWFRLVRNEAETQRDRALGLLDGDEESAEEAARRRLAQRA